MTTVESVADLAVTKADSADPVAAGTSFTYTITVENLGPSTATAVEVADTIPAGVAFVSSTETTGAFAAGVWTVGDMIDGALETLTITVSVPSGTAAGVIFENTATATTTSTDPVAGNDSATELTTVSLLSDLSVSKSVDLPVHNVGDPVLYTITVSNAGPSVATGVEVTDLLPPGVTFVGSTVTTGAYVAGTGVWTVGDMAVGASETLTIDATVDAGTGDSFIENTATITASDAADPDLTFNSDSATFFVPEADLSVTKIVDNPTPPEDDTITYTITVENLGPSDATAVELTDLLPTGVTFVSSSTLSGTYTSGTGIWAIGTITASAIVTLTITATVDAGTGGSDITNTASITAVTEEDPDLTNNSADVTIIIPSTAIVDVGLTKTVNDPTPNVGDVITYTVRVTNNDATFSATGVEVTDFVPVGVTLIPASIAVNGGSTSTVSSTITWDIPTLLPLQSFRLDFDATVDTGTAGSMIFNEVEITNLDQPDSDASNDDAFAKITVDAIRTLKTELVGQLEAERDGPAGSADSRLFAILDAAIGDIIKSLNPDFYDSDPILDRAQGNQVFHNEEKAVRTLDRLLLKADECLSTSSITVQYDNSLPVLIEVLEGGIIQVPSSAVILGPGDEITVTASPLPNDLTFAIKEPITENLLETIVIPDLCLQDAHEVFDGIGGIFTLEIFDFDKIFSFSSGEVDSSTLMVIENAIEEMVAADRGVALTELQFAIDNFAGDSQKIDDEIATAEAQIIEGDIDRAVPDFPKAIHHYEQAWHHASLALASAGFFLLPDIDVQKTVSDSAPAEGDTITYTITAENKGPVDLTSIRIDDELPIGVMHSSDSSTLGSYDESSGEWTIPSLLSGELATLTITVTVDPFTAGDLIMNTASYGTSTPIDEFTVPSTVTIIPVP